MMDKLTIMSWLEGLAQDDWRECHSDSEVQEIARQTLNMLKEQEPLAPGWSNGKAFCGQCGEPFPIHRGKIRRFCTYCGRQVKWDD